LAPRGLNRTLRVFPIHKDKMHDSVRFTSPVCPPIRAMHAVRIEHRSYPSFAYRMRARKIASSNCLQ
jgi:hypothetical protein